MSHSAWRASQEDWLANLRAPHDASAAGRLSFNVMNWSQNYSPVVNVGVSALIAALPVVVLLGLLAFWHVRAHYAALAGLVVAILIATIIYGMPPQLAFASVGLGAAYGFFPIGWIILNAIFIYTLSV